MELVEKRVTELLDGTYKNAMDRMPTGTNQFLMEYVNALGQTVKILAAEVDRLRGSHD